MVENHDGSPARSQPHPPIPLDKVWSDNQLIAMGRPSNTAERRADIVEAMVRVMARTGYAGASIAAIAEEAGLASGLVHYHFRSKQDVLLAVVDRLARTVDARFAIRSSSASSPRAELHAYVDAHLAEGSDADPAAVACWVALGAEALAQPEVRAAYGRVVEEDLERLVDIVRRTLKEEGGRAREARRIAAGLFAAIEGAFRLAAIAPGVIPAGSAAKTVRAMSDGLLASAGAQITR